jgi:hypothetical protein
MSVLGEAEKKDTGVRSFLKIEEIKISHNGEFFGR